MADPSRDDAVRALWSKGSYAVAGDWLAAASRDVLRVAGGSVAGPGRSVLDVACGTGAVAIAAAQAGSRVVGVDLTPDLLTVARERAAEAGVDVEFVAGSFEALDQLGLGAFDVVASSFGVMFAADPVAVAAQLARCARSGGTVAVAAWCPDGAFGRFPDELRALLPGPGVDYLQWSDPQVVAGFFAGTGCEVREHRQDGVGLTFASPAAAVQAFRRFSGPWITAFEHLAGSGQVETARELLEAFLAERSDPHPAGVSLRARYAVTTLDRLW